MTPLVSILMTAYNSEIYIAEAIESVQKLCYKNWELIITDDFSTDSTLLICSKYKSLDHRIRVYKNEKNLGDYKNRNRAASYANGKYLKYLDADDIIYPYGLSAMVYAMEKYPSAAFGLSFSVIDDIEPYPQFVKSECIIRSEFLHKSFLGVGPSAAIIKRDSFIETGGFSGEPYIGDTELWFKLASKHPLVKLAPALNWYRTHEAQQTKNELKNDSISVMRYKMKNKFLVENKHLFNQNEFDFAQKRLQRNFIKSHLKKVFKGGNTSSFFRILKMANISYLNAFNGFKPYLQSYNIS